MSTIKGIDWGTVGKATMFAMFFVILFTFEAAL